ncbi:MAG: hypothetical protein V1790_02410 [Planctomycetota bacterium]
MNLQNLRYRIERRRRNDFASSNPPQGLGRQPGWLTIRPGWYDIMQRVQGAERFTIASEATSCA